MDEEARAKKLAEYEALRRKKLGEYEALLHAMQSGVLMALSRAVERGERLGPDSRHECGPKHLRVGVNSALSEQASLAKLLVKKGIITWEEYAEAVIEGIRQEVETYERVLSKEFGTRIRLS